MTEVVKTKYVETNSEKKPAFSIIMPMHNSAKVVRESIESVQCQSFQNWELIVIDDKSTDQSLKIVTVMAHQDPRIKVHSLPANLGVAGARNFGMDQAIGRYICFLDSDDLWLPEKLATQFQVFCDGATIAFSSYFRRFEDGRTTLVKAPKTLGPRSLYKWNSIGNLTAAFDRQKLGLVHQVRHGHEDYIMWEALLKKARLAKGIQTPLAIYRVGATSLSSSKKRAATWQWRILRNHFNLGLFASLVYFTTYAVRGIALRVGEANQEKKAKPNSASRFLK